MKVKALLVGLLLIGFGLVGASIYGSSQAQQEEREICGFVEHFMILQRPAQIEGTDLQFIKLLNGLGENSQVFRNLQQRIQEKGPITTLEQLEELDIKRDTAIGKMLRIFFSLGGYCEIKV